MKVTEGPEELCFCELDPISIHCQKLKPKSGQGERVRTNLEESVALPQISLMSDPIGQLAC